MPNVIEFDRLVSYFDADTSSLEKGYARGLKIADQLEARFKKLKLSLGVTTGSGGGTSGAVTKELRQNIQLQAASARAEAAIERAKAATVQTQIREVQLEKERLRLASQSLAAENRTKASATAEAATRQRQLREAMNSIRGFERERAAGERRHTQLVEREARQQTNARNREQRRAANDFLAQLRRVNSEEQKSRSGGLQSFGGRNAILGGIAGAGAVGAALGLTTGLTSIVSEGREAYVTLDRLVRFTSTLDQKFQSPAALDKLRKDIEQLSVEVPQSAENIAKASFTVKSAFQDMTEPELIDFLRKFSLQATASNTSVDLHAERVAALAKLYKVTTGELDSFGAMLATSFGDALASDAAVGEGFNKILVSARMLKQPLNEVAAAMGAIQSTSSDAERNTTNLQNVFAKLGDPKYVKGMKEVFGVSVFDAQGNFKGLNAIVNELAKSMEGLTDEQRSGKIGEVFKDLQAREGLLSLIEVLDQYNSRLRDGADQEAFAAKQKVMLDSAEARWTLFLNSIENKKRQLGQNVADPITAAQDSQTGAGGAALFYTELNHTIEKGFLSIFETIHSGSMKLHTEMAQGLGITDPATSEKLQQEVTAFYEEQRRHFATMSDLTKADILQRQKKYFEDIANDPSATQALRDGAKQKAAALTSSIEEISRHAAEVNKAAMEKAAAQGIDVSAVGPNAEKQGSVLGLLFSGGLLSALVSQQGAIREEQNKLIQSGDTAGAATKGQSLGASFAQGMAAGISSGHGWVGAAVQGLISVAFSSGKQAQDSHSPSVRAAEELGAPFVQGIEQGIQGRAGALRSMVSSVMNAAMFKPKNKGGKKETDEAIRALLGTLGDDASEIDAVARRTQEKIERFYAATLALHTRGYDSEINTVKTYYDELFAAEDKQYSARLANIAAKEDAIRKLKKIKPEERDRELRRLGSERAGVEGDREQQVFDRGNARANAINEAGIRQIEIAQRDLARSVMESENSMIGVRRSAEQVAQTNFDNELNRIDSLISEYSELALTQHLAGNAQAAAELTNKIVEAQQERADAVVKGTGEIKQARLDDAESLRDYLRNLLDFARQSTDAQIEADEARLDALVAAGANDETIFAAEQALALRRENFRHTIRLQDIEAQKESLLALERNEALRLEILQNYNAQIEAETLRHSAVSSQIGANADSNTLAGGFRKMFSQLPTYKKEFNDFMLSIPSSIGNAFVSGVQQADGTWKGLMTSIYTSFLQTIQQMAAEMLRQQVTKLLINLGTSLFGGFGGGGGGGGNLSAGTASKIGFFPKFAAGGIPPMGRVSMVGENGPELFVPRVGGRILSNKDSKEALAGGGGGDTYNLSVTQNFKTPRALVSTKSTRQQAEAAATGLSAATKRRGR